MSTTTKPVWETLERWNGWVLMLAGVVLLGYAVSKGVYTFTDVTPVGAFDVAYGTAGLLITVVGLFGLYPRVCDRAPRLSIAGVVATAIAAGCSIALLVWVSAATLLTAGYPAIPEDAPAWTVAALALDFVAIAMGFLLFGTASLRTDAVSRRVGFLLVVPGLVWIGLLVANVVAPSGQYLGLLAYLPISIALLAVGYSLRVGSAPSDHVESTPDSIA